MRGWEDLTVEDVAKLSYRNRVKSRDSPAKPSNTSSTIKLHSKR